MSEEASSNVIANMEGEDEGAQLSQQSVASSEGDAQQLGAQAESAEQENAHAEPPELPDEPAERQPAQEVREEKGFPLACFQQYCTKQQVQLKTRMLAGSQICKLKADKSGFNDSSNDFVDIFFDETLQKHGIVVTNRNACRNWAAAQDQGCTRGDKCRFYHFAPGDLVDNFIGREPRKIGDIPVMLAGNAKAREYRWSETDLGKIDAKEEEVLQTFVAAAKQQKTRKRKKTFKQKMKEAIAKAQAEESDSTSEVEESQSESSTPPRETKRRKKSRKPSRKAKEGKKASKAKK